VLGIKRQLPLVRPVRDRKHVALDLVGRTAHRAHSSAGDGPPIPPLRPRASKGADALLPGAPAPAPWSRRAEKGYARSRTSSTRARTTSRSLGLGLGPGLSSWRLALSARRVQPGPPGSPTLEVGTLPARIAAALPDVSERVREAG